MHGLTIRWSLSGTPAATEQLLREHVAEDSPARSGTPGLHWMIWQMAERGFFAGVWVWATPQARSAFLESFRANPSRVTQLVGTGPELVQEWAVVGLAVGEQGPLSGA